MVAIPSLSAAYPLGSRLNERGRLEVGGCDTIELAAQFGTPAYVVAEDDLRSRARAFIQALGARRDQFGVVFASKAFPCTAVLSLFAQEGLWADVASGGELSLALGAGFAPQRVVYHGNARSETELALALEHGVGLVVIDNFDDIQRLIALTDGSGGTQAVLIRVTPGVAPDTHAAISTGQPDSKFGLGVADIGRAIEQVTAAPGLDLRGLHMHLGSQLLDLEPLRRGIEVLAGLGSYPVYDVGGGLGVDYGNGEDPPSIEEFVEAASSSLDARVGPGRCLLVEPGRALVANGAVTLYSVMSVKRNVSTWVAVDGGMSDNLRPMLYGARYEVQVADRFGGASRCHVAGKHCESGDVIVRDTLLDDPHPGDILVTPATGAYGYAMANNYNGVPRAPVIFCCDGDARVVVRRETFDDLRARDVN